VFSAGVPFVFVPVASLDAIAKADAYVQHWQACFSGCESTMAYLYCRQTIHGSSAFHARMFAPDAGVKEDPATGSAAAAFAGVIQHFDTLPDGTHRRIVEQGYEMGRPSLVTVTLHVERGRLDTVRIGGGSVRVAEGKIRV
jgi:trans-2,3-dihydro-3-hydroxyanthranilate isomerase